MVKVNEHHGNCHQFATGSSRLAKMSEPVFISLVIPAYNEEEAVASTLQRSTEAFRGDLSVHGIDQVEVILVSDGSHDQTLPRALSVPGVRVVSYEKNRGYGKAIETGYAAAKGNYLAFMDSDGTCNPAFIFNLWDHMKSTGSDVVLGCRMHGGSKMPKIRRLGNTLYAWLLSAISGQIIRDTASGMRLLKRDLLPRILPLPAGLHYTPAMSARCVLDPGIRISEVNMPYEERTGESKLNVARDGLIFLQTILVTALFYTPLRMFGALAAAGLLAGLPLWSSGDLPVSLVRYGLPWAVLCAGLGLFFHFFSKRILPHWPSGSLEVMLDRLLHPLALMAGGILFLAGSTCPALPHKDLAAVAGLTGGVGIFLSAGRFVLHQMNLWQECELPRDELLKDTTITDTAA